MVLPSARSRYPFSLFAGLFLLAGLHVFGIQGCVATRGWVTEQITPIDGRISQVEAQLGQTDTRLSKAETTAQEALESLGRLRLERQLVLGVRDGARFAFGSATLTPAAKHAIDLFLRNMEISDDTRFLVIGHTDSSGPEDVNYELGQKRAESVARYLISRKGIDPLQVTAVSYGESRPVADNASREGRLRNRCAEIRVYKEAIRAAPARQQLDLKRTSQMNPAPGLSG